MAKKVVKKRGPYVRTASIKTIKSTLQDMRRDGIVKVPPYSHLCKSCLIKLWDKLEKKEGKIISESGQNDAA